ncbi:MAG: hypothetical protein WC069_05925 [Candidatus Shapirobacteria bacterium]
MNKKSILKKYTGQGGLQTVGNTVRNVVRNITKGNDVTPKEAPESTTFKSKAVIPYSKESANPGPKGMEKVIVPSQRIPGAANKGRILPDVNAKKMNSPEFRDRIPANVMGSEISHDPSNKNLPKIPSISNGPEKEMKNDIRKKLLSQKVKSIM